MLLIGALVGLLSSVIPYSCELVALRSLRPAVFGILMSLEPAAAALAAIVVLQEHLSPIQWLAIGCVVAASIGATRSGADPSEPRGPSRRRPFGGPRHTGHMTGGDRTSKIALAALVLALGAATGGCSGTDAEPIPRVTQPTDLPSQPTPTDTPTDSESEPGTPSGSPGGPPEVVDTLVEGLEVPWGVDFLPDGDAVVTERISGRVDRVGTDGEVTPLGTVRGAPCPRARPASSASPCPRTSRPTGRCSST